MARDAALDQLAPPGHRAEALDAEVRLVRAGRHTRLVEVDLSTGGDLGSR